MSLLTIWFPSSAMLVFFVMVFVIGIPHGALDLWILRKKFALSNCNIIVLFIAYLSLAIGVFLGFYWFSSFFFGFFLLYSAYHFGMDYYDSSVFQAKVYCYFLALIIGLSIICLPALLHTQKICVLFSYLIGSEQAMLYAHFLQWAACCLLPAIGLGLFTLKKECAQEVIIVLMASLLAPPLAFLTVYFVGIHSCKYFAMLYKKIGYSSYRTFVKDLLPMTLLTYIFSITAFAFLSTSLDWQGAGFFLTIYMLAALTLPHLLLVEVFKKKGV
ncbi:Brp/Blh family beta-carotene 15,15'-dioxygenase [Legionella hackeliae]|nr:Brp/Blh family beta-carotene 15,15'-dioxygenase [Legionella hackeliae]